ncbi:Dynein light chain roadblock-type 1/2 like protein [Aduncisulcus paluster]|uniref:Dynein light chain roadblock n=1 Tax=Aduncisulcus paluster TaxID=2918883 RepID=A0ABQ5KP77_9EUKA|nr:Dynein light chain roadblock-type 1/2 like protein [Aduncisulcus paluster]|eukprot:gnl/Carplike_NY0171/1484_a2017_1368.p1 GENE.gnl/Carplike_NY0171/1484_a2017_1368~~gnl/Carplike_NY0171/1484_a2017_1368.p1  ORF type:complete len:100 (-),score=12.46 gnl/Carplike_NY0171/1484_a2017_1368:33-332(-)
MSQEIDEIIKRITSHRGVKGAIVMNSEGIPIRTTLEKDLATHYAALISHLTHEGCKLVNSTSGGKDDLKFLRIRNNKHEIMVAPEGKYVLVVIQEPSVE